MKKEFPIDDEWLPYEIHPDTPPEGILLSKYFPGMNAQQFFKSMDDRGRDMGIRFGPQPLMSNSRKALEAGEFARTHGKFEEYHSAVFKAYFTDLKNIGDQTVLIEIVEKLGLKGDALVAALSEKRYYPRLQQTAQTAREKGIRAAPTFLIEGGGLITGARTLEHFRSVLRLATTYQT